MTWRKAAMVLVVAGIFDLARAFFNMFWLFGPALAALYCTIKKSESISTWTLGLLGTKTAALVCSALAGVVGFYGVGPIESFGVVVADAVGLLGFLTLGLWIVITNARIFKAAAGAPLQFAGAFAVGEIPLIGTLPVFFFILWRLYRSQIRVEKEVYAKWEEENAAALSRQRNQQAAYLTQLQGVQLARLEQEQLLEEEAANDDVYIPQEMGRAA